jgi:hypothetical protein
MNIIEVVSLCNSLHLFAFSDKDGKDHGKGSKDGMPQLAVPRLSVCADAQKVDRAKLAQTEVSRTPNAKFMQIELTGVGCAPNHARSFQ